MDRRGARQELKIASNLAGGDFYDLAKDNVRLATGGIYKATLGDHEVTFKIDAKAKTGSKAGKTPVVSRLLRFQ